MIRCQEFHDWLTARGVDFFAGVPDSLLKPICFYLADHVGDKHVVAANEGGAVAVACGYHLATGKVPLVYLQNSGQGNTINPLLSLADRGCVQHSAGNADRLARRARHGRRAAARQAGQGDRQPAGGDGHTLASSCASRSPTLPQRCVEDLVAIAAAESRPVALLVSKGTFEPYKPKSLQPSDSSSR